LLNENEKEKEVRKGLKSKKLGKITCCQSKNEQLKLAKSSHETKGRRFPGEKLARFSSVFQCVLLKIS
jgi:hypothetical protein